VLLYPLVSQLATFGCANTDGIILIAYTLLVISSRFPIFMEFVQSIKLKIYQLIL